MTLRKREERCCLGAGTPRLKSQREICPVAQGVKLEGGKLVLSVLPDFINLAHLVRSLPGLLGWADS